MFTGSMMKLKSILYGTLPFYYTKVFEPSSPKLAYYDYFRKRGYTRYPYDFAAEYLEMSIAVLWDKEKELPYVMHRGSKRLYFPREYSTSKIEKCYRALLIEQDVRHPHHYADSVEEFRGKTLLDIGSAEELFAKADHLDFAICTYHKETDVVQIPAFLDRFNCSYSFTDGYMFVKHSLRKCLVRGSCQASS